MRLPNVENAVVAPRKVSEYLLAGTQPRCQHKVAFFAGLGYDAEKWRALADALLAHALQHAVTERDETQFGTWYTLEGEFAARRGDRPSIRTVWFIDSGNRIPRFVTAYPAPRGEP
jgi:hypothetical protein